MREGETLYGGVRSNSMHTLPYLGSADGKDHGHTRLAESSQSLGELGVGASPNTHRSKGTPGAAGLLQSSAGGQLLWKHD